MFLGTYEPKLDDKGRMFLPARFREDMQGGIVLTRGQEHCIYAFPVAEFESMTAELRRSIIHYLCNVDEVRKEIIN